MTSWDYGYFGGTFDPIHLGHIAFARLAKEQLGLRRLFFVPTHRNPLKDQGPHGSTEDRIRMVELALEEAKVPGFELYPDEARRPGPSYTVDTLTTLQNLHPGRWILLMGSEVFAHLAQWKNPRGLLERAAIALVTREGEAAPNIDGVLSAFDAQALRDKIARLSLPTPPYSATDIRTELTQISSKQRTQEACPVAGLQRSVWLYIKEKQLYAV